MKSRFFTLGVFVLVFVLASSGNIQQSAEQLYQSGLYKEEVGGELEEAIKLYERIIKNFPENHPIAAKALFHVGLCYEKLGNKKAQKAYQRLIKEYPGQIQEVNLAKERLSRLVKFTETISHEPTFRKIRIPTKISPEMRLSSDGQKISLETERKLWIMPLSGKLGPDFPGEPAELNTEDVDVDFSAHAWSGDGKWIAFNEYLPLEVPLEEQSKENMGNQSIYVVSSEGGTPKKVYETYRDQRMVNYRISLSPHGKTLAFSSVDVERNEQHIYTIPVDGGVLKKLVDIQAREPVFSPDV